MWEPSRRPAAGIADYKNLVGVRGAPPPAPQCNVPRGAALSTRPHSSALSPSALDRPCPC